MANITVLNVSHHKQEIDFYHANNPTGFGPEIYLFIHFILPAVVVIDGVEHITDEGACIIYSPGQKQEYRHHDGTFMNDFLIFNVDDPCFIARYGLPENEIFYVANPCEITRQLEIITYTLVDKIVDRSSETQGHLQNLFDNLANSYVENKPRLKRMFEIRQRFMALREDVRANPREWTVSQMAKQVWFTRSRFTVLYNQLFKTSPNADLMNIRVQYAKNLLKTTDLSVADISAACGYSSVEHFIRIFNKLAKRTPLQYRKSFQH
ncbi:MAG: helix-turn-helix transcriptional regulator [Defluviitaleaceae bacterium]|nr:helix-turn-helix transcriptional regulator [Defluviitaleaceae bacterium]